METLEEAHQEPSKKEINAARRPVILCVDDEKNILSSLRRSLRPCGYNVLVAESGAAGLEQLAEKPIDVVISDMRMPQMDGAAFLAEVANRYPSVVRILLTGYADLNSAVSAINEGNIYRYLSKPWEENDLRLTIAQAIEKLSLERERARLENLAKAQNDQLKVMNASLEEQVRARTAALDSAYRQLKENFRDTLAVFSHLVEMREGPNVGHARRVAETARDTAQILGMEADEIDSVYTAALLHDVGKLGLADSLIHTPYVKLTAKDRQAYEQHPTLGEAALVSLEPLAEASTYIRAHHERFDGKGYPDGLAGEDIPLGARILCVANDFDGAVTGALLGTPKDEDNAREFLERNAGERYDPRVLEAFFQTVDQRSADCVQSSGSPMSADELRPGMVLTQDLPYRNGILLLGRGRTLTEPMINRIRRFARESDEKLWVHVKRHQSGMRDSR